MKEYRVASQICHTYDRAELSRALSQALLSLSPKGLADHVKPGDRVALKVNMLMGKAPEKTITTHPELVAAVAEMVMELGAHPFIIDSPGGPYTASALRLAYERCGFASVARELGIELNLDTSTTTVSAAQGLRIRNTEMLKPAVEADVLINLPKLKTHGLTTMTCAVKNMFGMIPGMQKIEFHMRSPEVDGFCAMLVDVANLASPELTIVDAVIAMEGEGPSGGNPRQVGLVIAGEDMHAVDTFAAEIMGLDVSDVPTLRLAREAGMGPDSPDQLLVLGARLEPQSFLLPTARVRTHLLNQFLPASWAEAAARKLRPIPQFSADICTRCGICVRSCPPVALSLTQKETTPTLDEGACIRCFCCQELCPEHAISVKRSLLGRLLFR